MYSIRQNGDKWELLDSDGNVVCSEATYDLALGVLSDLLAAQLAAAPPLAPDTAPDGLLPERWVSDLCFSEDTGDGRDFTNVTWSSRDPNVSTLPLMLQTETEIGHFGAELAGYFDTITLGPAPVGGGRFYDSEVGRAFRDMLLDGRTFGVSVDPGAVMAEFICDDYDEEGWCIDGHAEFQEYEIIGVTGTPFPAFARASIKLDTASAVAASAASADDEASNTTDSSLSAAGGGTAVATAPARTRDRTLIPVRPPLSWFNNPALLMPTPLTITEQGHVMGHVAAWGTCHVGSERLCITPPTSRLGYRHFLTGEVLTDAGARTPTGALTWGIPHADLSATLLQAQAHYADSRHGWADVSIGEDDHGIWIAGACRPQLDDADLRVLRALALSGDWRYDRSVDDLELCAALAVNVPGFPIPRVVTASALSFDQPRMRAGVGAGMRQTSLVASGIVIPTAYATLTRQPCGCGDASTSSTGDLARIERKLDTVLRRTSHLTSDAIEHVASRLRLPEREAERPPASYSPHAR